jgi:hypothetical protein
MRSQVIISDPDLKIHMALIKLSLYKWLRLSELELIVLF